MGDGISGDPALAALFGAGGQPQPGGSTPSGLLGDPFASVAAAARWPILVELRTWVAAGVQVYGPGDYLVVFDAHRMAYAHRHEALALMAGD